MTCRPARYRKWMVQRIDKHLLEMCEKVAGMWLWQERTVRRVKPGTHWKVRYDLYISRFSLVHILTILARWTVERVTYSAEQQLLFHRLYQWSKVSKSLQPKSFYQFNIKTCKWPRDMKISMKNIIFLHYGCILLRNVFLWKYLLAKN